jgi:hypothetical protein
MHGPTNPKNKHLIFTTYSRITKIKQINSPPPKTVCYTCQQRSLNSQTASSQFLLKALKKILNLMFRFHPLPARSLSCLISTDKSHLRTNVHSWKPFFCDWYLNISADLNDNATSIIFQYTKKWQKNWEALWYTDCSTTFAWSSELANKNLL